MAFLKASTHFRTYYYYYYYYHHYYHHHHHHHHYGAIVRCRSMSVAICP